MNRRAPVQRRSLPSSPFTAQREAAALAQQQFAVDDRVTHDRHGLGTVVDVEEGSCVVDFGAERRRITLAGGKLHKL
jgi:hypothetical protein